MAENLDNTVLVDQRDQEGYTSDTRKNGDVDTRPISCRWRPSCPRRRGSWSGGHIQLNSALQKSVKGRDLTRAGHSI